LSSTIFQTELYFLQMKLDMKNSRVKTYSLTLSLNRSIGNDVLSYFCCICVTRSIPYDFHTHGQIRNAKKAFSSYQKHAHRTYLLEIHTPTYSIKTLRWYTVLELQKTFTHQQTDCFLRVSYLLLPFHLWRKF